MPSSVTHAFFAMDVYDSMNSDIKKLLKNNKNDLKMFSEGPDPLYFYNLGNFKKGKSVRNIYAKNIHTTNTKDFFTYIIKYIKDNKLENNPQIIAFLYGFICHYHLDTTLHPYIIYKTGVFKNDDPLTYKYNGLHHEMEVYIDAYMIFKRKKILPKNFKLHKYIFENIKFNDETKKFLDNSFKEIYKIDNFSNIYLKSIKQMKNINKFYRYDKFGIKKCLYKIIDLILPNKYVKKENLSYHMNHYKKKHYLNLNKEEWNHPIDKYETYNYSLVELYKIALNKAIKTINEVNNILYENENISKLDNIFKNLSYRTGKVCDDNRDLKYFEF